MPNEADKILLRLSRKADKITDAIDKRQRALGRKLTGLEKELFALLQLDLFGRLEFEKGKLVNSVENIALLVRIDRVFDRFRQQFLTGVLRDYVADLLEVSALTGEMYEGMATEALLRRITRDNAVLQAAIGVTNSGNVVQGSLLWEISQSNQVRQGVKNVVVSAIQSGQTLREFTRALRDYVQGSPGASGRLVTHWRTYAYDVFNQAAEVKNEQFRRGLDLEWFIYVGDVIKDSRDFCRKKAGGVFAVIEADTEWPNDPDLIGKKSGIPYTPRIDRGRWNCRHRIRYITEEMAQELDAPKVERIKVKYGS